MARALGLLVVAAATAIADPTPAGAQLTIDNDVPPATLGYWDTFLLSGSLAVSARVTTFRYGSADIGVTKETLGVFRALIDVGNDGGAVALDNTVTTEAALTADDEVTSSGSFTGSNGNTIDWTAVSRIDDGSPFLVTTYTFAAQQGTLGILRFHQYSDQDVPDRIDDDTFFFRGSASAGDLELFTIDDFEGYGVAARGSYDASQGLVGATFAGWASGAVSDILGPLFGAGLTVSPEGEIDTSSLPPFVHRLFGDAFGPNDVAADLAWDLDPQATSATIVTTLGGVPQPTRPLTPQIPTLSGLGVVVLALALGAIALARLNRST